MKLDGLKNAVRSGAASTGHTAQNLGNWLYRHLFTVVATVAIAGAFLFVPQINHVAWQVPGVTHAGAFEVVVFWTYLAFLVVLFGGLCWFSLPSKVRATDSLRTATSPARTPDHACEPPAVASPEGDPDAARPHGKVWRSCSWFAALLTLLAKRLDARTRTGIGVAALVSGAIWRFLPGVGVGARFALEDASRTALALILGLIGVWAVFFDSGRKHPSAPPHYHVAVAGRALWLMLLTYLFGEAMWYCAYGYHLAATPRAYTLWALMQFAFLMVLVARCIDTVHIYSRVNVRGWSLPVFAIGFAVFGAEPVGKQGEVAIKEVPAVDGSWFEALEARLDRIPKGPAVIVTVSGGGSRAAIFAGLVFERLSSLPVSKEAKDTFRDHVVLISAVSGGSLASAYEVYTLAGAKERLLPEPRNSFHDELLARMATSVHQMRERSSELGASNDSLAEVLDQLAKDIAAESGHVDTASPATGVHDDVRAAVHGCFADDMATDFMAPMLRGALLPGIERGTRLCDFWRERFGWADVQNLAKHDPTHPLLVLNATDNGRGVRLAIGFPSLPRGLLGETMSSLSDVAPGWALDLAQAVRLSANFPWGLQVGSLSLAEPAPEPLQWIHASKEDEVPHAWNLCDRSRVNVLDGGIIDNTGIDTVARLFDRLRRVETADGTSAAPVDAPASERVASVRSKAIAVLKKLRERKVLLVEIDAGRKFQPGGLLSSWFPTVFAPLSSLQAASHVNSLLRKQSHLSVLADALDPDDHTTRFMSVPFVCNREEDVMTAWALGSEDKARIMVQFLAESRMQAGQLQTAFSDLSTGTTRDQGKEKQLKIDAEAKVRHERYSLNVQQQVKVAPQPPKGSLPPPDIKRRIDPKGLEWRQSK